MRPCTAIVVSIICTITLTACNHENNEPQSTSDAQRVSREPSNTPPTAAHNEMPAKMNVSGVLQSHPDAQGHSVWTLVGDRSSGGMRVDISRVRDVATGLDGKRVQITGHMLEHSESSSKATIVADKIVPAPE